MCVCACVRVCACVFICSLFALLKREKETRTAESDALLLRFMCLPPLSTAMRQLPALAWPGAARAATLRQWQPGEPIVQQVCVRHEAAAPREVMCDGEVMRDGEVMCEGRVVSTGRWAQGGEHKG